MNELSCVKISSINDFSNLYDELSSDNSTYIYNIDYLFESFKNGFMYGIKLNMLLLPCFCIINNDVCEIMWVHSKSRFKGYGKYFIYSLKIKYALTPVGKSLEFWEKCNVELI